MPDAPDWQRIVVGPAGIPVGGSVISANPYSVYQTLGALGTTMNPTSPSAQGALGAGVIRFQVFTAAKTGSIGHISLYVSVANVATPNQNF